MIVDDFLVDLVRMIQMIPNSLHSFLQSVVSILVALIKADFYPCKLLLQLIHHLLVIHLVRFFTLCYILVVVHVSLELIIGVSNCFICFRLVFFYDLFFLIHLFFSEIALEHFLVELLLFVGVVDALDLFLHFFLDVGGVLLDEDGCFFVFEKLVRCQFCNLFILLVFYGRHLILVTFHALGSHDHASLLLHVGFGTVRFAKGDIYGW